MVGHRLRDTQREAIQKKARYWSKKLHEPPTATVAETAFYIVALSAGDWVAARRYLQQEAERVVEKLRVVHRSFYHLTAESLAIPTASDLPSQLWLDAVEQRWRISTDSSRRAALTSFHKTTADRVAKARKYLAEMDLCSWVSTQNSKGLAPSVRLTSTQMQRVEASQWRHPSKDVSGLKLKRRRQQWLRRWAKRQSVKKGRFGAGTVLSVTEMRLKAQS